MCETNGQELFAGTCVRVEDIFDQMWESWEQHSRLSNFISYTPPARLLRCNQRTLLGTYSDDVSDFSSPNWALPIEL